MTDPAVLAMVAAYARSSDRVIRKDAVERLDEFLDERDDNPDS